VLTILPTYPGLFTANGARDLPPRPPFGPPLNQVLPPDRGPALSNQPEVNDRGWFASQPTSFSFLKTFVLPFFFFLLKQPISPLPFPHFPFFTICQFRPLVFQKPFGDSPQDRELVVCPPMLEGLSPPKCFGDCVSPPVFFLNFHTLLPPLFFPPPFLLGVVIFISPL